VQVENEVSRIRDVSEYELIQDREQVSEGEFKIRYYIKLIFCQMINFIIFQIIK
jgi:hypothetical protein